MGAFKDSVKRVVQSGGCLLRFIPPFLAPNNRNSIFSRTARTFHLDLTRSKPIFAFVFFVDESIGYICPQVSFCQNRERGHTVCQGKRRPSIIHFPLPIKRDSGQCLIQVEFTIVGIRVRYRISTSFVCFLPNKHVIILSAHANRCICPSRFLRLPEGKG